MKTRLFRHIGVALASTLVLSSLALTSPVGAPTAQAAPVTVTIDTSDKTSVQNAYLNVYLTNVSVQNGWTGNLDTCSAGTISEAARDATINVINYYRALAGLNPVTENTTATTGAQQAALVMAANKALNHTPPSDWACMSTNPYAGTAAGESNLNIGLTSVQSIGSYMSDNGTNNTDVGHRRWVLYPLQSEVGIGAAGPGPYPNIANALQLWGLSGMQTNSRPDPNHDVPWPTAGYFPYQNLPDSGRWSYSASNVNFGTGAGTTVTVTKWTEGSTDAPTTISVLNSYGATAGYGDPTFVWNMPTIEQPKPGTVDDYTVTISGAVNTSYVVKVFTPVQQVVVDSVSITGARTDGTAAIGTTLTATASGVNPTDAMLTYAWYRDNGTTSIATGSQYTTTVADAGHTLTVKVVGSKSGWTSSDQVASSTSVTVDSLISLIGTITSDDHTSVSDVIVAFDNVTCGTNVDISGANDNSGTTISASDGTFSFAMIPGQCYKISPVSTDGLIVNSGGSGTAIGYTQSGATSYDITLNKLAFDKVEIPGTTTVGTSITGTLSGVQPNTATLTYQWYRADNENPTPVAITGATSVSYTTTATDENKQLTLTAKATVGTSYIERTSNPVTVGTAPAITFTPPIYVDGATAATAAVGQTLTTSIDGVPTGWTPKYQWLSDDGVAGGEFVAISGATTDTYKLVPGDAKTNIAVRVTLTQPGYENAVGTSSTVNVKAVYTVTFDARNDTTVIVKSVVDGGKVSLPADPTLTDYIFSGWLSPDGNAFTADTPVTGNITVTAVWAPVPKYNVSYDANGGTGQMSDPQSYRENDQVTVLKNSFENVGNTFDGWNTSADGKGTQYGPDATFLMGTDNVTLFAQWVKEGTTTVTYTVKYDAGSGTGTMTDETTYPANSQAEILDNTFTRVGYIFAGWKDAAGNSYNAGDKITMTADVTLTAQWTEEQKPVTYTVTYVANNGSTDTMTDTKAYQAGDSATVAGTIFTYDGYEFNGWKDAAGTSYKAGDPITITGNVTLTAQWTAAPTTPVTTYTVKYDSNSGTGTMTDPKAYESGTTATVMGNTFTKAGYTFTGWTTAADGTGTTYQPDASITMTSNVTLYAQWKQNEVLPGVQYTVTYEPNGGKGASFVATYAANATATAASNEFTYEGYTFVGWNTAKDGTGTGYSVAATFPVTGNVTLYAQWTANETTPTTPEAPAAQAPTVGAEVQSGGRTANSPALVLFGLALIAAGGIVIRWRKHA